MCGIIGIFGVRPASERDRLEVEQGAEWMRLRGPDGAGFFARDEIYFGHRRLAILDPEAGKQPWVDPDSGVVLVFNGELFNFWELRARLKSKGVVLRTQCDTELLMGAYRIWGRDCLKHLDGMFAFAIYDPADRSCWLVRDRLGVKPLYYHVEGSCLRFASSIKGLCAFEAVGRRLDRAAMAHYLRTIRTSLGRRTLIDGVSSLGAGEMLLWRKGQTAAEPSAYWSIFDLPILGKEFIPSFDAACEETRARVRRAVERQMISDVPLGGFLSGGIDSSILAAEASDFSRSQLGTFSVGYDREGYNEWEAIRENVRHHQLTNEEIHLSPENYVEDWKWLIAEKGQPLSTPNEVPIYRLSRAFGRRYKVALSGEGADEVFGGYVIPTFCAHDWERFSAGPGGIDKECFRQAYGTLEAGSPQDHFFRVNSWLSRGRVAALFDSSLAPERDEDPVDLYYRILFAAGAPDTTFGTYLKIHAKVNLEGLLNRLDTSTMAASVEGRVPFTDHHLVEWLFSLPDAYKMCLRAGLSLEKLPHQSVYDFDREGLVESKRLLRRAYANRLPKQILERPKVSFPVPFAELFAGPWEDLYRAALADLNGPAGLLNPKERAVLLAEKSVDPMLAWPLVNLFLWQQEFSVGFST